MEYPRVDENNDIGWSVFHEDIPGLDDLMRQCEQRAEEVPLFQNTFNTREKVEHLLENVVGQKEDFYGNYASCFQARKEAMESALEAGDTNTLKKEVSKAFILTRIFRIHEKIEEIVTHISPVSSEVKVETLLRIAEDANSIASDERPFPFFHIGCEKAYEKLRDKLKELVKQLAVYNSAELDKRWKLQMFGRLKKYLEDLDFPAILSQLN